MGDTFLTTDLATQRVHVYSHNMPNPDFAPLRASLWELGLKTPSPVEACRFYAQALGYVFTEQGDRSVGTAPQRRLVLERADKAGLAHVAYAVASIEDLEELEGRLARAGAVYQSAQHRGFVRSIQVLDPDGNRFIFGVARPEGPLGSAPAGLSARLQHVVFASRDPQRLISFYTQSVGFRVSDNVLDDRGGLRTAFLRCSAEHHSLAVFLAETNRLDHHCYETPDWNAIRDWADHLSRMGVKLKWGPGRHGPGNNLFLFVHDSDGNWVELSAELELVQPDRPVGEWPHEERTLNSWGIGLLRS